jgi:methanogenic corrinoid protein MtbC1
MKGSDMTTRDVNELRIVLEKSIGRGDRGTALSAALAAVQDDRATIPALYGVLSELLRQTGSAWRSGTVAVWQEHVATAIVRTIIEAVAPTVIARARELNGRTAVLACPEDETHELGLRMLADRFILEGWNVVYLGADSPASDIAAAAEASHAELVVLSASTHFHRVRLLAIMESLAGNAPGVRVLVGGPAICGELEAPLADHVLDPAEFFEDLTGLVPACGEV